MSDEDKFKQLEDFFAPEDLDEELETCIEESSFAGEVIKHPLIYAIPYHPTMNKHLNEMLEHKREAVNRYFEEGRPEASIWLYERPYRLPRFLAIADYLSDEVYWKTLSEIWTDSENIWQNEEDWRTALLSPQEGRTEHFMDQDERDRLQSLPERLKVYRGFQTRGNAEGMSWTLNRSVAVWFAHRHLSKERKEEPYLATAEVDRVDVIAIQLARKEDEIILDPRKLKIKLKYLR